MTIWPLANGNHQRATPHMRSADRGTKRRPFERAMAVKTKRAWRSRCAAPARMTSPLSRQEGAVAGGLVPPDGLAGAVELDHGALGKVGNHEVTVPYFGDDAGCDGARGSPEAFA